MTGDLKRISSSGSCLCGAVTFQVDLPAKWVAHCHCTRCQRAHGAAFVTWVGVDATSSLRWHVSEQGGRRGFCPTYGSPMFFKSDRWPGELHIARALFVEPIDQEPQVHGDFDTHVSWVMLGDKLPWKVDPGLGGAGT